MLGRKILKRITRLGMAFYTMVWCMSFTVCAYDNPIADMAVKGNAALMTAEVAEADAAVLDEALPDDPDLTLPAEGEEILSSQEDGRPDAEDAEESEEDVDAPEADEQGEDPSSEEDAESSETVSDDDAETDPEAETDIDVTGEETEEVISGEAELLEEDPADPETEDTIVIGDYPDGYLLVNDTSVTYNVSIRGSGIFAIDQSKVNYTVLQDPYDDESLNYGSAVEYHDGDNYLTFSDLFPYTHADTLLIKANYTYEDESGEHTLNASLPVAVANPIRSFSLTLEGAAGTETEMIGEDTPTYDFGEIEGEGSYTFSLTDIVPESGDVNFNWEIFNMTESGLSWISGNGVEIVRDTDDGTKAELCFEEFDKSMRICVIVSYYSSVELPEIGFVYLSKLYAAGLIDAKAAVPELEAHLTETSIKAQIYKVQNPVPVTIRTANASESYRVNYTILSASFENSEISKYLYMGILNDGKTVSIRATGYTLNGMSQTELAAFLKKKFSTKLYITAEVNGVNKIYTTSENLTISMDAVMPNAKNVKIVNTLEFNSYYALDETRELQFEGINPNAFSVTYDYDQLNKLGMHQAGPRHVQLHPGGPASGKGSIKVILHWNYGYSDEIWNLPGGFTLELAAKYVIKNQPPVLVLNKTSVLLNSKYDQAEYVTFELTKEQYKSSSFIRKYYNSSNKEIDGGDFPFNVNIDYDRNTCTGRVTIGCTDEAKPGATYKLELTPYCTSNYAPSKIITIKTVDQKNEDKISITAKGKGSIDASAPTKYVNLTLTAKNINLYSGYKTFSASLKNGTDVTEYFYVDQDYYNSNTFYLLTKSDDSHKFPLLEKEINLAGQQVNFKLSFDFAGDGNPDDYVSATYSTKIANSKVATKLKTSSVTINPKHYNSTNDIYIPIISNDSWYYDYNIVSDLGDESPFDADIAYDDYIYLKLAPKTGDLTSYAGKTITYKITPEIPGGNAATATFKVIIQKPAKSKISVSAKVSGTIDAISDLTYASINVTYKNVYITNSTTLEYHCIRITTKQGKSEVDATEWFDTWYGEYRDGDSWTLKVFRNRDEDVDIPAGTYKAVIRCYYYDIDAGTPDYMANYVDTTVNFKVKRGKPNLSVTPSPATLINRDFARAANITIVPKAAGVNDIREVRITGNYNGNVTLTRVRDTDTYMLEFDNNYYEGSWVKKTWMAITKNVTRTIPAEVYFYGSTAPEKINLKVKINP